jgi:HEAT repeat protein
MYFFQLYFFMQSRRHCDFLTTQCSDVREEFASGLLHNFLVHGDESGRSSIALAAKEGNSRIIEGLITCFQVGDTRSRMEACISLCGLIETDTEHATIAVEFLIRILKNDKEWIVRLSAAQALKVLFLGVIHMHHSYLTVMSR